MSENETEETEFYAQSVATFVEGNVTDPEEPEPVGRDRIGQFVSDAGWETAPDDAIAAALDREYIRDVGDGYVPGNDPEQRIESGVFPAEDGEEEPSSNE